MNAQEQDNKHQVCPEDVSNRELSKTKSDNLYTTFAFLLEAFLENAPPKYKRKNEPNISAIAKKIEELATIANNNESLKSQRIESIKERIEEALRVKKQQLPQK